VASSPKPESSSASQPESRAYFVRAVEDILRQLAPRLGEAIQLAAIPHRLEAGLLSRLRGESQDTDGLLTEMRRLGFIVETPAGLLAYPEVLREVVLTRMQRQPDSYRRASAQAADYYRSRLNQSENLNPERDLLEVLYHQLAADEISGLNELRLYFDRFLQTRQPGLASQLFQYALEQQPVLSRSSQDWLRYLGAQLNQANVSLDASLSIYRQLAEAATDPGLRATARRSLGEALAQSQRFVESIAELQGALKDFQRIDDPLQIAGVQAALGGVFVTLAESAGGLRDDPLNLETALEKLLYFLQHAPFLIYRWFSRRFFLAPNLYFGSDYQNWIIIRYLYSAIGWLSRADRRLTENNSGSRPDVSLAQVHIQIRLADLNQRVGRWARAGRLFNALAKDPAVQASLYLQALVLLGQSSLLIARREFELAIPLLDECQTAFRQYGDLNSAGKAARLIGQAHIRLGDEQAALVDYLEAAEAFYRTDDLLNATETRIRAQLLSQRRPADEQNAARLAAFARQFPRQAYMERFPDGNGFLHGLFRGFAAYFVLPLTYLLLIWLAFTQTLWTSMAEMLVVAGGGATLALRLADFVAALPYLLLMPMLAFWIYEAIFVAVGVVVARLLPQFLITRQQGLYYVLDEQTLGCYDQNGKLVDFLPWSEATFFASLDRRIWRQPLTLFSRFMIGGPKTTFIVNGIVNRYLPFKQEAGRRLEAKSPPVQPDRLDFSLLNKRWGIVVATLVFLLTGLAILTKFIVPNQGFIYLATASGIKATLYATEVVFQFWKWLILIGPLFALIQLLQIHRQVRRRLGPSAPASPDWPVLAAILVLLFFTIAEIVDLFIY
jgi:hypothetical protein